jgi:O-antigen/teichoic acid export membrane protein
MIENSGKYIYVEKTLSIKKRIMEKVESSPLLYRLAKGTFWSLLGTVGTRVFSMVTTIFIARILGKESYGAYGMVQSTLGMFGLFAGFAMGSTMTKYVAELRETNPDKAGRILSLTKILSIISSGVMSFILILMASWLAKETLKRPDLAPIITSGAVLMFVSTLNSVQTGALSGFEAFKVIARINFIQGAVTPLISIPLVYYYEIQGAIISLILVSALGYLLCNISLKKECIRYGISVRRFDLQAISEWPIIWKFSFPAVMSGLLFIPVTWITNTILVNQKNGYAELGLFNAANQWRQFIIFIPQILASVMLPIFSETYGREDKKDFLDAFNINFRLTWIVALPITVVVIAMRHPLAGLYGSQYADTAQIITLLMVTSFLNIVNNVVGMALAGAGRMWTGTAFNLAWAIVLVSSTEFLVPLYGGYGLAAAYLLAYLLHTIWQMTYVEIKLAKSSVFSNAKLIALTMATLIPACLLEYFKLGSVFVKIIIDGILILIASSPLYRLSRKSIFNID